MLKLRGLPGLVTCTLIAACGPPGAGTEATVEPGTSMSGATEAGPGSAVTGPGDEAGATTTTTGPTPTTGPTTGDTTTDAASSSPTGGSSGSSGEPMKIDCTELAIADPVLLAAIRDELDIPEGPISGEAALALTTLQLSFNEPVASLAGVECLHGLQALRLRTTTITDLGPLQPLIQLRELLVWSSAVDDLEPLVGLPLESLAMTDAPLAELGPLAAIPTLLHLRIANTVVQDLTPLIGHPALQGFSGDGTAPQSLLPLASIPTLASITLVGCGLTSVSELAEASALQVLALDDNQLTDLAGLAGMSDLTTLSAANNQISSLAPLAGLSALQFVTLDHNKIVALDPLAGATALKRLALSDNQISDLKPLAGATALSVLSVGNNPLTGLQGIESLSLGVLSAANTGLKQMLVVAPQTLTNLELSNNQIADLAPLAGHAELDFVRLDHNAIVDLGPIAQAPWVLAGCAVLDVRANPLSADSLATTLPAMCKLDMTATWDLGNCAPGQFDCGGP